MTFTLGGREFDAVSVAKLLLALVACIVALIILFDVDRSAGPSAAPAAAAPDSLNGTASQSDRTKMTALMKRTGGDYSKLSKSERDWVETFSHGRGRRIFTTSSKPTMGGAAAEKPPPTAVLPGSVPHLYPQ